MADGWEEQTITETAQHAVRKYGASAHVCKEYGKAGTVAVQWGAGRPSGEYNDCAVRALAVVSPLTYEQAHALIADKCGRENRKGTPAHALRALLDDLAPRVQTGNIKTLCQFTKAFPRGVFYVRVPGHALAVIDGKVVDMGRTAGQRSRFRDAWKFAD